MKGFHTVLSATALYPSLVFTDAYTGTEMLRSGQERGQSRHAKLLPISVETRRSETSIILRS